MHPRPSKAGYFTASKVLCAQNYNQHSDTMPTDALHRFLFEGSTIRGEFVQLENSWQELYSRQNYPAPVRQVLGEAAAAGVLLAATIKFAGTLTLQLSAAGGISFLVVECTGEHHLRGLARWRDEAVTTAGEQQLLGSGQLMLTIDQGADTERYQSIIELNGGPLAHCLDDYFLRSDQLPTRLWLATDGNRASGLLLQKMPEIQTATQTDTDLWNRVTRLAATVQGDELLGLEPNDLLRRLFHEETVRVFTPQPWTFHCPCSHTRVDAMLRGLGRDELQSILDEQGQISIDCEFCGHPYRYDTVDVEHLLSGDPDMDSRSSIRH